MSPWNKHSLSPYKWVRCGVVSNKTEPMSRLPRQGRHEKDLVELGVGHILQEHKGASSGGRRSSQSSEPKTSHRQSGHLEEGFVDHTVAQCW